VASLVSRGIVSSLFKPACIHFESDLL
jgi:hypothetical protein